MGGTAAPRPPGWQPLLAGIFPYCPEQVFIVAFHVPGDVFPFHGLAPDPDGTGFQMDIWYQERCHFRQM